MRLKLQKQSALKLAQVELSLEAEDNATSSELYRIPPPARAGDSKSRDHRERRGVVNQIRL